MSDRSDIDAKERLAELRGRLDEIDGRIVPLFRERMGVSLQAAAVKVRENMPLRDSAREQAIVDRAAALAGADLRGEAALLMRAVIALSREYQRGKILRGEARLLPPAREPARQNVTCAYRGAPGEWSGQALLKLFPDAVRVRADFLEDVFLAVKEGRADYGVAAIENSRTGAIGETYDLLRKYGCFIVGRTWIDMRRAPDVTDSADNRTSFVVIASEPEYDGESDLVSVTFSTEHRAGALCETLMAFMAQGINLLRIESRPASGGTYRFFAELSGSVLDSATSSALRQAASACEYFEVIGCYRSS
jgi:prephenate dehydratase/chorismate mutase